MHHVRPSGHHGRVSGALIVAVVLALPGVLQPAAALAIPTFSRIQDTPPVPAIPWTQAQKLLASDGTENGAFGDAVAIDGNRLVVGAYGDAVQGERSGAAYVYERNGSGDWIEVAKLLASDGAAGDVFGASVSISGDRILVGAYGDDDNGSLSGSAYVFERDGSGTWIQVDKLTASDAAFEDNFGISVGIAGDRLVVGAWEDDDQGSGTGSAYVYERDPSGNWLEVQKLVASDATANQYFGDSVAVVGDWLVVGAFGADDVGERSGATYVFERGVSGGWTEVDRLVASDPAALDYFGYSVAAAGDRVVVGAYGNDDHGERSGSAYVYEREGSGDWVEVDKLVPSDGAPDDNFGRSVGISGDLVVAGAFWDDDNGLDSGSAYVYEDDGSGDWVEMDKLRASDAAANALLGWSVAISGARVVASAFSDTNAGGVAAGAAYVFEIPSQDTTPPTATIGLPADGSRYTLGDASFASFVCDDGAGSGVVSCTGTVPNGAAIDTATLGVHAFSVEAIDAAGNSFTATATYEVVAAGDTVAPQVWVNRPANGDTFARNQANVIVAFACADIPGSGIASCTGTQAVGTLINTATPGTYPFSVTAVDVAGNATTVNTTYTVLGGAADTAPPVISVVTPVHLARYATGSTHLVSFSCSDPTVPSSGIASCTASTPNGTPLNTSVARDLPYAVGIVSVDNAGNVTNYSYKYFVVTDSDGDGLSDAWETQGIDVDKDGVIDLHLEQAPYNADPLHRDVFVEMDYMTCLLPPSSCATGDRTSQAPQPGAVDDVVAAFAAAPLMNPDGATGIRLHLDVDEAVPEIKNLPFSPVAGPDNDFEDIRSGAAGACNGRFGTVAERATPTCPKLIQAKAVVYRYGLWAHSYLFGFGSSGLAEMPGNDFIITTGGDVTRWTNAAGSLRAAEAGTLMHELGHTLGLNHGGKADANNCKSNYLSVMNYALQVPSFVPGRPLDYSRSVLPTLFEGALVEAAGIGGPSGQSTVFAKTNQDPQIAPASGPIDWNRDGDTLDTVSANINNLTLVCPATPANETLLGAEDWSDLVYSFTAAPDFAPGSRFSAEELLGQELVATAAEAAAELTDFDADGVPNASDVCPAVADPAQTDTDNDGIGNACEPDPLAPVAAPTNAPAPNAAGWNRTNVTVTWHWTDEAGGSGIDPAHCTTSSVSSGEGAAVAVSATCQDLAGNVGTATRQLKVDKTAPLIVCPTLQRRVLNTVGATLTAGVTDTGGSGVASPTITVAMPTNSAGVRTVTVAVTDRAGNTTSVSCGYQVTYRIVWLIPVAGVTSTMSVLRNTVVPFTFRLVDAKGAPVNSAVVTAPTAVVTACPSGATRRVISLPGNAVTRKLGNGWWLAGWKAQTAWRGSCRLVTIGLSDGTSIAAVLRVD